MPSAWLCWRAPVQRILPQPGVKGPHLGSAELGWRFHILETPRRPDFLRIQLCCSMLHRCSCTWPRVLVIPLPCTKLRWRAHGPKAPGHPSVQMTYWPCAKLGRRGFGQKAPGKSGFLGICSPMDLPQLDNKKK